MKIRCEREKLWSAFQTAMLFAPAKSPKEILQNVKLDVDADGATLTATDMEVGIRISLDGVEVNKPGSAVLASGKVGAILRESGDEFISLEATKRGVMLRGDRSEFKLPSGDPDEFPAFPNFAEDKYHRISAPLFKQILTRTEFATDLESSRYALGGVLVELDANSVNAICTDGRRLAKMEGPAESVGGHKTGDTMTIIRTQSLRLFMRSILDSDDEVHLVCRTNDVLLRTPRATFYSRLVEGRFPRWRDVFPDRRHMQKIQFTVGPLNAAIRQAAILTSNESRGVDFCFSPGTLTLMTSTADVGQAQVELPISYDGPQVTITFDHRFVADFLKVLSTEATFTFELENSETAAVFSAEDDKYGYVIMPLSREK